MIGVGDFVESRLGGAGTTSSEKRDADHGGEDRILDVHDSSLLYIIYRVQSSGEKRRKAREGGRRAKGGEARRSMEER